jgi:RNA polymerase sigma factor FliA
VNTARLSPEQRRRVERGKPLVDQLARVLVRRLGQVAEEELRSAGYEALVRCGLRYDPSQAASFRTYAFHRVRGAMIDVARRNLPELRRRSRALRTMQATQALLEQAERRHASHGSDPRTLQERVDAAAERVAQTTAAVVLSRLGGRDPESVADETFHDPEAAVHDVRLLDHLRRVLDRCCSEDERAMLTAIYEEGLTMSELGARLGRDKSTISRRHAALLQRIADELGIDPHPG